MAASQPTLPIWRTFSDAYRHLWRHRGPYLGQLLVWALILFVAQTLAGVAMTAAVFRALDLPLRIEVIRVPYFVASVLCLITGGGAIFLSCASALMSQQAPRLSDALRLRRIGPFWRAMIQYWLIVHLLPTAAAYAGNTYMLTHRDNPLWLSYQTIHWGYWAWAFVAAPLVVLAVPIAAFEQSAAPLREGWIRSRGNRLRILGLAVLSAAPLVAAKQGFRYSWDPLWNALGTNGWWPGTMWLFRFVTEMVEDSLSFLLILALSIAVVSAYARLSPKFEHVMRVFD